MISPLLLERPGRWQPLGVIVCFLPAFIFTGPLFWRALAGPAASAIGAPFTDAVSTSMIAAGLVGLAAVAIGLPAGVMAGLYQFRGRALLLALNMLPALVPSFLWAIGWSALAIRSGTTATETLNGLTGVVLALSSLATPVVLLTAFVATRSLTASQVDAARLCGGERAVLLHACRHAAPAATLAATLAALLTLGDPGPGMIFGLRTAAADILTSFSAQYDFVRAGRQCLLLTAVVLLIATPGLTVAGSRLAQAVMARQLAAAWPVRHHLMGCLAATLLGALLTVALLLPLVGLLLPLLRGSEFARAGGALIRTGFNTAGYGLGTGVLAAMLGLLCTVFVGRSSRWRLVVFTAALLVLVQPPALIALGVVELGASAPPAADFLLRSRATVCLALAARLFSIALLLGLRAWAGMSPSWAHAAAVHGVPLTRYMRRVVLPCLAPSGLAAVLVVALLATADVGTVLLLHPPGLQSLPLNIFTVMANAPEALVASLCLVYIFGSALGLCLALPFVKGGRRWA